MERGHKGELYILRKCMDEMWRICNARSLPKRLDNKALKIHNQIMNLRAEVIELAAKEAPDGR